MRSCGRQKNKMDYFFDSYAIIEIIEGNQDYEKFSNIMFITNALHLSEVFYYLLRTTNEETANKIIGKLNFEFLEITPELAIEASKFKHRHKKEKLSFADCIGYITSIKNDLTFLTGDGDFKDKENVEFIK